MTVTRVQAVGNDTGSSTAASLTVTFAAATAGNLLVAAANSDATVTASAGWTLVDSAVSNQGTYLFYKIAAGGETSVTLTPSVTDTVAGAVLEYSGITASPLDVSAHANRTSSSGVTAATGTTAATAQAVELVICVAGPHSFGFNNPPMSAGWGVATNRVSRATIHATNAINVALFVGDYTTSSTGAQSDTCTWTDSSQDAGGVIGTFKATAGGSVSGDVSATATAGGTVTAASSAVGGASSAGTAGVTATGANAAAGAATATVTAGATAVGVKAATGGASLTATGGVTADATVGSVAIMAVTATAVADAAVQGGQHGSWYTLLDIYREAEGDARAERSSLPQACPNDGEPLRDGPDGDLYCPYDGWRPGDRYVGAGF